MPNSFDVGLIDPMADRFDFGGVAGGRPRYGNRIPLPATVPSIVTLAPETWATIVVGIGLVGIRLRRRSRLAGARHFT
jgi:hypothetical protein